MEQEEYKNDGLNIPKVDFIDNQACLDVIEKVFFLWTTNINIASYWYIQHG